MEKKYGFIKLNPIEFKDVQKLLKWLVLNLVVNR